MARNGSSKLSKKGGCVLRRRELALRFWQTIPSTLSALEKVIARVMRVARAMECAKGELPKVELALREALTNAIVHGSGGDPKKRVAVCCLCDEARGMLLVIRDSGPGFDPTEVPDPTHAENVYRTHGRGVYLMRQLMDEVHFFDGGRQVVMAKAARKARSGRRVTASALHRSAGA